MSRELASYMPILPTDYSANKTGLEAISGISNNEHFLISPVFDGHSFSSCSRRVNHTSMVDCRTNARSLVSLERASL